MGFFFFGGSAAEDDEAGDSGRDAAEPALGFDVEFECQDVKSVFFIDDLKAATSRASADMVSDEVVVANDDFAAPEPSKLTV